MRRSALLLLGLALLVATPGLASSQPAARASLRLLDRDPFIVQGGGFRAHERVTVTLTAKTRLVRRATARGTGTFTVSFGAVSIGRCDGFRLEASGNRGSRASLKLPAPACHVNGSAGSYG